MPFVPSPNTAVHPDGLVFDQTYKTRELDPATNVPTSLTVGNTVVGYATALQEMVVGDIWRIYIPYDLGYGSVKKSGSAIPVYSTLIFDVNVTKIY